MTDNNFQNLPQPNTQQLKQIIKNYFTPHRKYQQLQNANLKLQELISKGNLTVSEQQKLPQIQMKQSGVKQNKNDQYRYKSITPTSKRQNTSSSRRDSSIINVTKLQKMRERKQNNQPLSNRNRRLAESLVQKYSIVYHNIQSNSHNNLEIESILDKIVKKYNQYYQHLANSSFRMQVSSEEEEYIQSLPRNIRIKEQMNQDLHTLKQYAQQMNCSLHRKGKKYEMTNQIRLKLKLLHSQTKNPTDQHSIDLLPQRQASPSVNFSKVSHKRSHTSGQQRNAQQMTALIMSKQAVRECLNRSQIRRIGVDNLQYSKRVGLQSRQIIKNERGSIRFVREVLHHWWIDNEKESNAVTIDH